MLSKGTHNPSDENFHFQSHDHMSFSTESYYNSPIPSAKIHQNNFIPQRSEHPDNSINYNRNAVVTASINGVDGIPNTVDSSLDIYRNYPTPGTSHMAVDRLLSLLPQASCHSLHFPLQKCQDKAQKILRFVESHCEVSLQQV